MAETQRLAYGSLAELLRRVAHRSMGSALLIASGLLLCVASSNANDAIAPYLLIAGLPMILLGVIPHFARGATTEPTTREESNGHESADAPAPGLGSENSAASETRATDLEAADLFFSKAWLRIKEENESHDTVEDSLREITNVCVKACMIAGGHSDMKVTDHGDFWVKLYKIERNAHGRLQLTPAACSSNTPVHEENIRLTFNEGGAGVVLAKVLKALDSGRTADTIYVCDRATTLARLSRENSLSLERSRFAGECCFPITAGPDSSEETFYGVACFCAGTEAAFLEMKKQAKQNRVRITARLAGRLISRQPGGWGAWSRTSPDGDDPQPSPE